VASSEPIIAISSFAVLALVFIAVEKCALARS
jgi:hypothetical protein